MAAAGVRHISQMRTGILQRQNRGCTNLRQPFTIRSASTTSTLEHVPDFAFAFDIDGVLLRSSTPIPGASQALSFLQKQSIPFVLLTNGGGTTEAQRTSTISSRLSIPLDASMIIQSHTPFSELVHSQGKNSPASSSNFFSNTNLQNKTVLVCGGDQDLCAKVARTYGFAEIITPGDIFAAHPEIWPFSKNFQSYYSQFAKPLPRPINPTNPSESLKIDAVFIFNDPRDWGLDIQLLLDVLLSRGGILGTYSAKNGDTSLENRGYLQDGQPPVYFSNPDLLWAAEYHLSRLGQGGFREALEGVWRAVTNGAQLNCNTIGKPHVETYEFAERKLLRHRAKMFGGQAEDGMLKRVYMVGDNPESDIAGANNYRSPRGVQWISLLTRTGVYRDVPGRKPSHEPKAVVDDVKAAVQWAVRDSAWHSSLD